MDRVYAEGDTETIAQAVLGTLSPSDKHASVLGLSGDLGAGKTTLVQSIAKALGVTGTVVSPTFIIAKFYETADSRWNKLIHIDAYRIEDPKELEILGWKDMVLSPNTLIIVEWPERIETLLPPTTIRFKIEHKNESRHISSV